MVTPGDKPPISCIPVTKPNYQQKKKEDDQTKKMLSDYEQSREKRIKQNLERMQKLGIFDLSLKLKSLKPTSANSTPSSIRRTLRHSSSLPSAPGPIRRSSRLQNVTPVSYSEVHLTKKNEPLENDHDLLREEGSKPEIYTEEHEKLLGSTELSWTLFVDGVGKDGKRIYDPVNGKTCHQCRQKTLGHRTHCSKCNKVQGQFCGDCLYMRYGEHVLEANQKPNWICPVCRGICNCSLCRQAKGWPPTGSLYRKISSLGFKSVAHYLIQTRRSNSDLETNSGTKVPTSVKRSLPFSDAVEISIGKESSESNIKTQGSEYPQSESKMTNSCLEDGKQEEKKCFLNNDKQGDCEVDNNLELNIQPDLTTNCNTENPLRIGEMGKEKDLHICSNIPWENSVESSTKLVLLKACFDEKGASETELETRAGNLKEFGKRHLDCFIAPESSPRAKKKYGHTSEPLAGSIAGRLRQRRQTGNEHEEDMLKGAKNGTPDIKQELSNISSPGKAEATVCHSNSTTPDVTPVAVTVSIVGRLRQRRKTGNVHGEDMSTGTKNGTLDIKQELSNISSPGKAKATVNRLNSTTPDVTPVAVTDSIAGRLRQRHNQGNHCKEQRSTGAKNGISGVEAEASLNHTTSTTPDVTPTTRSNSSKKRVHVSEPSPDSIAGRLRQRRAEVKVV